MKLPSLVHKPYLYFWFTALVILLKGMFDHLVYDDPTTDINIHDTYFVIPHLYFAVLFALLYFIAGLLYRLFKKFRLICILVRIHTLVSVVGVIAYPIVIPLVALTDDVFSDRTNTAITILFCLVGLVQLLFIVNLIIAPFRGRRTAI